MGILLGVVANCIVFHLTFCFTLCNCCPKTLICVASSESSIPLQRYDIIAIAFKIGRIDVMFQKVARTIYQEQYLSLIRQ